MSGKSFVMNSWNGTSMRRRAEIVNAAAPAPGSSRISELTQRNGGNRPSRCVRTPWVGRNIGPGQAPLLTVTPQFGQETETGSSLTVTIR